MSKEHKLLLLRICSWVLPILMVLTTATLIWDAQATSTAYESLVVSDVALSDSELSLRLDCTDSARLFKWRRYDIVNGTLYLEVGSGPLFGHRWPVYVHIRSPYLKHVSSVYLRNGTSAKLVYIK